MSDSGNPEVQGTKSTPGSAVGLSPGLSQMAQVNRLADTIGDFMEYWGFKSIHGRIWTHLFIANRPLTGQELTRRLVVSKALVSISLKELLGYKVIILDRSNGRKVYRVNPDTAEVILEVLKNREYVLLSKIETEFKNLRELQGFQPDARLDVQQIQALGVMVSSARDALKNFISSNNVPINLVDFFNFRT